MSSIEHLITVADLANYPDDDGNRYELIEGELFVSTAPGIPHQITLRNLVVNLQKHLDEHPTAIMVPGAGAVLSNFDAVIPDLVVVRNERWKQIVADNRFMAAPDLVIEILSPGPENRRRDLEAKRLLYGKYGVEEYWVADPEARSVTVYRLIDGTLSEEASCRETEEIYSRVLSTLRLRVDSLFV